MSGPAANPVQSCPKKQSFKPDSPQKQTKHFVKFKLVDEKGTPLQNILIHVVLPDGIHLEKVSDKNGMIEITNVDPGQCRLKFPWQKVKMDDAALLQG